MKPILIAIKRTLRIISWFEKQRKKKKDKRSTFKKNDMQIIAE